ncbi:NRDE family protein [Salinispira pacifica]|nr:NRDE family protein [Salinispira pacifica]
MTFFPETAGGTPRWIFFNRDEQRTRGRAEPPRLFNGRGGDYLMPVDPDSGGSWMGVHSNGFFLALINNYPGDQIIRDPGMRSRGLLIRDLLESGRPPLHPDIERQIRNHEYAPFFLVLLGQRLTRAWEWDGSMITTLDVPGDRPGIISSSGIEHGRITAQRKEQFQRFLGEAGGAGPQWDPKKFADFHRRTSSRRPDEAICMSRSDAHTVSISEICLDQNEALLHYYPDPPFTDPLSYGVAVQASSHPQN